MLESLELGMWFFPTSYLIISLCFDNLGNGYRRYMINVCLANIFEVEESKRSCLRVPQLIYRAFSQTEVSGLLDSLLYLVLIRFMHVGKCHAQRNSTLVCSDYLVMFNLDHLRMRKLQV